MLSRSHPVDLLLILLTLACFGLIALALRGLERL
ncbi:hypothetical protein Dcae01_03140 [Deinococcus caeni]|uniref:Potassium-transporting ATPase n=1 Tax=Deinococcus caeni TaxID=569127 RepID=A0ABP9UMR3_9DEIO